MQYTYPEVTKLDTFYTGSDGYLITPEVLPYGNYTLVEVQAPYGYVLDSTPVPFTVSEEQSGQDSGVTVITVEKERGDMRRRQIQRDENRGGVLLCAGVGDGVVDKDGNLGRREYLHACCAVTGAGRGGI